MMRKKMVTISCILSGLLLTIGISACGNTPSTTGPSPFTHGNVQLNLKKGETTQADVLQNFGPPNVATVDGDGNEVWTYQKHATVSKSTESGVGATVILLGAGRSTSGFERSSRTMTLIIKFGKDTKVIDFKSMSTSF